jgi:hypothetical protein
MTKMKMEKTDFNCPQCGQMGCSIASINNRESSTQEYSGSIGSSGIGLASGGLGIGVGTSHISIDGKKTSKRAAIFSEPHKPEKESLYEFQHLVMIIAPFFMILMATQAGFLGGVNGFLKEIATIFPVLYLVVGFYLWITKDRSQEESIIESNYKKALDKYRKQTNLYNSIRYCEPCNILFENENNICELANLEGYKKAMKPIRG